MLTIGVGIKQISNCWACPGALSSCVLPTAQESVLVDFPTRNYRLQNDRKNDEANLYTRSCAKQVRSSWEH